VTLADLVQNQYVTVKASRSQSFIMHDMNRIVGSHDILFITLDTLRYDVAQKAFREGRTPVMASLLPSGGWQLRHAPANFTYAAHQAFFAGFLPTPVSPGPHPRLFAAEFPGSETTVADTWTFPEPDIVQGLESCGYWTVCVGGVGFFNKLTSLGSALPSLFRESYWSEEMGVTCRDSTKNQVALASTIIQRLSPEQRLFLFLNVAALHQPNCMYQQGATEDSPDTQLEALAYVDSCLPTLLETMRDRAAVFGIICSDHGTTYGEGGYTGHRLNHPVVGDVPYTDFVLPRTHGQS